MSARKNRAVHTLASICLIPKAISELPKAAIENVKVFAEDVKEEMEWRKKLVREETRNQA